MLHTVYPGVYLTEIAFRAHPVDGVPTGAPSDWTGANVHDPGITLLQLLAWTAQPLRFGLDAVPHPWQRQAVREDGTGDDPP